MGVIEEGIDLKTILERVLETRLYKLRDLRGDLKKQI
jgi:hypothetical protein